LYTTYDRKTNAENREGLVRLSTTNIHTDIQKLVAVMQS